MARRDPGEETWQEPELSDSHQSGMRVALLSDTHGHFEPQITELVEECDEIWHAGDIGDLKVARRLESLKPMRAVWGNIDGPELRQEYPEVSVFECEGVKVFMIHIGGYPGRYAKGVKAQLKEARPDLFICGHSHILKVMPDEKLGLMHMTPGACGRQGFHLEKTLLRFTLKDGLIRDLQVCKMGPR